MVINGRDCEKYERNVAFKCMTNTQKQENESILLGSNRTKKRKILFVDHRQEKYHLNKIFTHRPSPGLVSHISSDDGLI